MYLLEYYNLPLQSIFITFIINLRKKHPNIENQMDISLKIYFVMFYLLN